MIDVAGGIVLFLMGLVALFIAVRVLIVVADILSEFSTDILTVAGCVGIAAVITFVASSA